MVAAVLLTAGGRRRRRRRQHRREPRANPTNQGCNGYIELCAQPLNQVVWPASHNAMSSSAYNFLGAEHTITIPEQLNAGARFLMLDAYYGYDDNGLVRTNLAGGVEPRSSSRRSAAPTRSHELDRLGALTGAADTSGKKQDVYFCHDFCELGAVPATEVFDDIGDFLDRNLTDVVILDFEDYVKPKDIDQALVDAGLFDRVWTPSPERHRVADAATTWWCPKKRRRPRTHAPADRDEREARGRVPVAARRLHVSQETPFTFTSIKDFNCKPNRGRRPTSASSSSTTGCGPTARPTRSRPPRSTRRRCSTDRLAAVHRRAAAAPERGRGRLHRHR